MNLDFTFSNMDQLKKAYDPLVVEKAAYETIRQLQARAATEISRAVRQQYVVSASAVKSALKNPRVRMQAGVPVGYLIYLSRRISLRHFSTGARPRVKTARGVRYGARARVRKDERAKLVTGGFIGRAKTSGSEQIFQRMGTSRLKIRKLTAPSISQMVGGGEPLKALQHLMQNEGDAKFAHNLDHFIQKQSGLR